MHRHWTRLVGVLATGALMLMLPSAPTGASGPGPVVNRNVPAAGATSKPLVAGGLQPMDLNHGASAATLAASLVGGGVSISNVAFTGSPNAAGTFTGGTGVVGFEQGIILGSGSVQTTPASVVCGDPGTGVEGPNSCDWNSTINGTPGDPLLDTLSGYPTFDASRLDFDFVPQFASVQFRYVFSSDEYNEYANTTFNDVFAFLVNGTNCALVPTTTLPVSVDTINGGNPYGVDPQHPEYYLNNDLDDGGGAINTEMDGLTTILDCNAAVTPGVTNHLTLAIADASDQVWDSNVFIEGSSLVSGTQVSTVLSGGGKTGELISVPLLTDVTDSATLRGVDHDTASGTMTYSVYTDAACTVLFADAGTKTVVAGEAPDSDPVLLSTAGRYYWVASYSGDLVNNPASSPCGEEIATVITHADPDAPRCSSTFDAQRLEITIVDRRSGLQSVVLQSAPNANVVIPPFPPGTTEDVLVTATKQAPGPSGVHLTVTDTSGNSRVCAFGRL